MADVTRAQVLAQASDFLSLISRITDPSDLHFTCALAPSADVAPLVAQAAECACGDPASAVASLAVVAGASGGFEVRGSHARAVLPVDRQRKVVWIFVILAAVVAVCLALFRR